MRRIGLVAILGFALASAAQAGETSAPVRVVNHTSENVVLNVKSWLNAQGERIRSEASWQIPAASNALLTDGAHTLTAAEVQCSLSTRHGTAPEEGKAWVYRYRGGPYLEIGIYTNTLAQPIDLTGWFTRELERDPLNALAFYYRGQSRLDEGDYEAAVLDFAGTLALDPAYAKAYVNRGVAWALLDETDYAIAAFTDGVRLEPEARVAFLLFYNRALCWFRKGDTEKAAADIRQAVGIDADRVRQLYADMRHVYAGPTGHTLRDEYRAEQAQAQAKAEKTAAETPEARQQARAEFKDWVDRHIGPLLSELRKTHEAYTLSRNAPHRLTLLAGFDSCVERIRQQWKSRPSSFSQPRYAEAVQLEYERIRSAVQQADKEIYGRKREFEF
ncbi:MAG: hypothetical protein JXR37_04610 [Kiritimatiellae bacterium]|nr:hypothetical protein [Kiritimatiellia bacterium]